MKPGIAAQLVADIRINNAIPFMESVLAVGLAYSAKLVPDGSVGAAAFWANSYFAQVSAILSEINEQQFMNIELAEQLARDVYVARCRMAYSPMPVTTVEQATVGWDDNTHASYLSARRAFSSEFGTNAED